MDYITTTDLRTKASKLRDSLAKGDTTYLVHRSKVIGIIEPYGGAKEHEKLPSKNFMKHLNALRPEKATNYEERDKLRRKYLEEKYGKIVS